MSRPVVAFFDVDHTILEVNSGSKWVGHQWRRGELTPRELARALRWMAQYKFGLLDYGGMARRVLRSYAGKPVAPVEDEVARFFADRVAWSICVEARQRIAFHRAQGHTLALLTSATRFLSSVVAEAVGIEHILCTDVCVEEGRFTGEVVEPLCYGVGKVDKASAFVAERGVQLRDCYFYSDSISDLPMLDAVGHPRVVNPDPRLRRKAKERGWSVEQWRAPARKRVEVEPRTVEER